MVEPFSSTKSTLAQRDRRAQTPAHCLEDPRRPSAGIRSVQTAASLGARVRPRRACIPPCLRHHWLLRSSPSETRAEPLPTHCLSCCCARRARVAGAGAARERHQGRWSRSGRLPYLIPYVASDAHGQGCEPTPQKSPTGNPPPPRRRGLQGGRGPQARGAGRGARGLRGRGGRPRALPGGGGAAGRAQERHVAPRTGAEVAAGWEGSPAGSPRCGGRVNAGRRCRGHSRSQQSGQPPPRAPGHATSRPHSRSGARGVHRAPGPALRLRVGGRTLSPRERARMAEGGASPFPPTTGPQVLPHTRMEERRVSTAPVPKQG